MYHKAPAYGSGHYARPINRQPKVGYQEPRADVARPSKPRDYGNGEFNKYKLAYTHKTPDERGERYVEDPQSVASQRKLTRGCDTTSVARDKRLNPTKTPYGEGAYRGDSYVKPGGNTGAKDPRPWGSYLQARTVPKVAGSRNDGTVPHVAYGQGALARNAAGRMDAFGEKPRPSVPEHQDCRGFHRLSERGVFDPELNGQNKKIREHIQACKEGRAKGTYQTDVLVNRSSTLRWLGPDEKEKMNGCTGAAPPQPGYGDGNYTSPTKSHTRAVSAPLDSTKQYSLQPGGRAHYHEAQQKYLPTNREAVTGYHFPLPEYGSGYHAEPVREQNGYDASFSAPSKLDRYHAAFSSPRVGIF